MARKLRTELLEMGFNVDEENFELPKLKIIAKRFRDLARKTHSDKADVEDDSAFISLRKAYKTFLDFFDNQKNSELVKLDDNVIQNLFKDFNFTKKNTSSFTVLIDEILEEKYGTTDDKGPQ